MDDDNLSDRLARDLDATFATLVRAHQDRLFSIALRLLGDRRDAEEVAQDAFVRAYRALTTYEPDRVREIALRAWLATIVVNLSRNRMRARRGRPASLSLDSPAGSRGGGPAAEHIPDGRATEPGDVADRRAGQARWAGLVAALPRRYREPVVLRHVDDLSYAEMAEALGRPAGTLKAQVHRGLALLRAAHEADERATADAPFSSAPVGTSASPGIAGTSASPGIAGSSALPGIAGSSALPGIAGSSASPASDDTPASSPAGDDTPAASPATPLLEVVR